MTFSIDTYSWLEAYWWPLIPAIITLCLIVFHPFWVQRFVNVEHPPHVKPPEGPRKARSESRKVVLLLTLATTFLTAISWSGVSAILPDSLKPMSPTEITANAAEVHLSPSDTQPDKLCYTLDDRTSCVDRDSVPAELSLDEPALLLTIGDAQTVATLDASNEELEKQVAYALDMWGTEVDRVHLLNR